ncbi:MAG: hypothetical protein ACP5M4_13160 [Acidobacteriaceae bacterium]
MKSGVRSCSVIISVLMGLAIGSPAQIAQRKPVDLAYRLILQQCHGKACHDQVAATGRVRLLLEAENSSFAWGYQGIQRKIGNVEYYLRFLTSFDAKKAKGYTISVGFAGRMGAPPHDKQITWASTKASGHAWSVIPRIVASGDRYANLQDTTTPRLEVRVVPK